MASTPLCSCLSCGASPGQQHWSVRGLSLYLLMPDEAVLGERLQLLPLPLPQPLPLSLSLSLSLRLLLVAIRRGLWKAPGCGRIMTPRSDRIVRSHSTVMHTRV